jgi:hypothetical protein
MTENMQQRSSFVLEYPCEDIFYDTLKNEEISKKVLQFATFDENEEVKHSWFTRLAFTTPIRIERSTV